MPQDFLCAIALTVTLTTTVTTMTRDDDHSDGSKLTLPRFDPKRKTPYQVPIFSILYTILSMSTTTGR